jgi:DNA-binding MarR family transcriptional regulator
MRPTGLTSGQFSILMSLNRPDPPTIRAVAELLAMDRTTLTANLKPLVRRGFVRIRVDQTDRRGRRLILTLKGRAALAAALPAWEDGHAMIEPVLAGRKADRLRADLRALA